MSTLTRITLGRLVVGGTGTAISYGMLEAVVNGPKIEATVSNSLQASVTAAGITATIDRSLVTAGLHNTNLHANIKTDTVTVK